MIFCAAGSVTVNFELCEDVLMLSLDGISLPTHARDCRLCFFVKDSLLRRQVRFRVGYAQGPDKSLPRAVLCRGPCTLNPDYSAASRIRKIDVIFAHDIVPLLCSVSGVAGASVGGDHPAHHHHRANCSACQEQLSHPPSYSARKATDSSIFQRLCKRVWEIGVQDTLAEAL